MVPVGYGVNGYTLYIVASDHATNPDEIRFAKTGVEGIYSGLAIADTNWHHIVVTKVGSDVVFYKDGIASSVKTLDQTFTFTTNLVIGIREDISIYPFNGTIDEVRVYNRALTDAEVKFHYNRGGPVGYWKFDEGSGTTAYDSTNNNNDGTISGATWTTGKNGTALSLDGNDYIEVPHNSSFNFGTGDFTLQAWVKYTSGYHIASKMTDGNNLWWFTFGGNKIVFNLYNANVADTVTGDTLVNDGNFHFATVTRSSGTLKIYTDTIEEDSISSTKTMSFTGNLFIGKWSGEYYTGLIDDVRIYNYARTPDQIYLDYNAGLSTHFK